MLTKIARSTFTFFHHLKERRAEESFLVVQILFSMATAFIAPTYVLFLMSHGLNTLQTNEVNTYFMIAVFCLQTPTGAFADIYGRKNSVVLGTFFWAIGAFVYFEATSFWGFVAGEMGAALGRSFMSGAFEAWLFDHLESQQQQDRYRKILSRSYMISRLGGIPVGLISGYIGAHVSLALPWLIAGLLSFIAAIAALTLMKDGNKPKHEAETPTPKRGIGSLMAITGDSVKHIVASRMIMALIISGTLLVFSVQAINMYWTPLFTQTIGQEYVGVIFSAISVAVVLGYFLASHDRIAKRHPLATLVVLVFVEGAPLLLATLLRSPILILATFIIHETPRSAFDPIFSAYFNSFVPANLRATVNSLGAAFNTLGAVAGLLLSGWISVKFSILTSWTISAATIVLAAFLLLLMFKRQKGGVTIEKVE